MQKFTYKVILTNGVLEDEYIVSAFGSTDAIIIAQAQAMRKCRDYQLVSIEEV